MLKDTSNLKSTWILSHLITGFLSVKQDLQLASRHWLQSQPAEVHKCWVCLKVFQHGSTLKRHKREAHIKEAKFNCHRCEFATNRRYRFDQHKCKFFESRSKSLPFKKVLP